MVVWDMFLRGARKSGLGVFKTEAFSYTEFIHEQTRNTLLDLIERIGRVCTVIFRR